MKKLLYVLMAMILLGAVAFADVPSLSDSVFTCAKNTLKALATGNYENISSSLPYSGGAPDADTWASAAASLASGSPQTKYAVAYWTGNAWKVAVPVDEPSSGSVQCFYLTTADGSAFNGYGLTDWESVSNEYRSADYVIWKDEYQGASSATVEFDS